MVQVATLTDQNEQTETQEAGYLSDLSNDEDSHPKVFKKLAENDSEDEFHPQYVKQPPRKKETLLKAALKGKIFTV